MLLKISLLPDSAKYILVAIVLLLVIAVRVFQYLGERKRPLATFTPGAAREYGVAGGAICPRCQRPFPLDLLSPHLLIYKLARCPYCGKTSFIQRASIDQLRAAEARELSASQAASVPAAKNEAERLKDLIDESKYSD